MELNTLQSIALPADLKVVQIVPVLPSLIRLLGDHNLFPRRDINLGSHILGTWMLHLSKVIHKVTYVRLEATTAKQTYTSRYQIKIL
jgi:hypothetical protein